MKDSIGVSSNHFVKDIQGKYKVQLDKRLFNFSVEIMKFILVLPPKREYDVFRNQLSRSGTAIGANFEEACAAFSHKEFMSKLGICLKESRETNYWLRIIDKLGLGERPVRTRLKNESLEFVKIFTTSLKTARSRHTNKT